MVDTAPVTVNFAAVVEISPTDWGEGVPVGQGSVVEELDSPQEGVRRKPARFQSHSPLARKASPYADRHVGHASRLNLRPKRPKVLQVECLLMPVSEVPWVRRSAPLGDSLLPPPFLLLLQGGERQQSCWVGLVRLGGIHVCGVIMFWLIYLLVEPRAL